MKNLISNISRVKVLSKAEQKFINGGNIQCFIDCHESCLASSGGDRIVYGDCRAACFANC